MDMSDERTRLLTLLREEFGCWKGLLSDLSEAQIAASRLPNGWSIRDLTAHLMAWQQISVARLEAARLGREPALPDWLAGLDPDAETKLNQINARIYAIYREQPWSTIHEGWAGGFSHFLELAAELPEDDLQDAEKYPWLRGYALADVLKGSYEHHHVDHLESLRAWARQQESGIEG